MGDRRFFAGVKRPGREADHSPTSSAQVTKTRALHPLPLNALMAHTVNTLAVPLTQL
jgi:hypothetical protein